MLQADELSAGGSGAEPMFQLATGLLADGGFAVSATLPATSYRFRMHMFILKVKFNWHRHQNYQTFISDLINDIKLSLFAS